MAKRQIIRRPQEAAIEVKTEKPRGVPKRPPQSEKAKMARRRQAKPTKTKVQPKFAKRPYKPRAVPTIPKPVFWPIQELPGNPPVVSTGGDLGDSTFQLWGNRDYLALVTAEPCPTYPEQIDARTGQLTGYLLAATIRHRPQRNPHASNQPIAIYAIEVLRPVKPTKRGLLQRLFGSEEKPSHMALVRFTQGDKAILAKFEFEDGFVANRKRLLDQARRDLGPTGRFTLEPMTV